MRYAAFLDFGYIIYQLGKENAAGAKIGENNYIMNNNNNIFNKHIVVVLKDGEIVEQYDSVKDFYAVYQIKTYSCIADRIRLRKDDWLPDGKIARYYPDRHKAGTPLRMQMIREREKTVSEREQWRQDLDETEAKIQEAYDLCERGEITFEERHHRLGWLQNHAKVLRQRLNIKSKRED